MAFELIKVSELPELTTPSDPNVLPIQDGDYLKRISFENLKEAITGDVADDLAAEVTARESAVSDEATARGNADAAILADLASAYSASATYAVGDYCTKDGQLYRCTTAISTAEAWTAAHWSAVALGDDTSDLRSALNSEIGILSAELSNEVNNTYSWATGGIYAADGTPYVATTRLRTSIFTDKKTVGVKTGYKYSVYAYSDNVYIGCWDGSVLKKTGAWLTNTINLNIIGDYQFRIVLAKGSDGDIAYSESVNLINEVITDKTLTKAFKCADAKIVGKYFDKLSITRLDGQNLAWVSGSINPSGEEGGTNNYIRSGFVSVDPQSNFAYTGDVEFNGAPTIAFICEYNGSTFLKRTVLYLEGYNDVVTSPKCNNVRFVLGHASSYGVETNVSEAWHFEAFTYGITVNQLQASQKDFYVKNLLNKTDQIKNVEWHTLGAIYKNDGTVLTAANKDVKGIPYSSAKEYDKYVGYNVSLKTFMTAAKNPYSLLYTENINKNVNTSGYGIEYHGINCGCYYGNVCSSLVSFALGTPIQYDSVNWNKYLPKVGAVKLTETQTANDLQIGDIIWQEGHVLFVTDVVSDGNKNVTQVVLTETSGTYPISTTLTATQFNNQMVTYNRKIYRYNYLYRNTDYEPSVFIACEGETLNGEYHYNEDVCTFAGDYAAFHSGEEIWINYNLGTTVYTTLLIKNASGNTVASYNLESGHKISIGTNLSAGIYTAVLSDGTNESESTHFEVIDTTVSATVSGNIVTMNFSSANGTPLYFKVCQLDGTVLALKEFTHDERLIGTCAVDVVALHNAQFNTVISGNTYLKVFFKGRYGVVRNELLQIQLV